MAVTDDERREVAQRLRELRLDPWDDAACEIALCAGVACCNSECHGSDETPECTMALASRLADLIEPDESGQNQDTNPDTVQKESPAVLKVPECDRDALLGLADEMQGHADAEDYDGDGRINAGCLWSYADRIREALGVADG